MATATAPTTTQTPALDAAIPLADADVMKRGIKRVLPCKLTEREFMGIAKQRVDKEALLDQVVEDFDAIKTKHKAQVEELQGEIDKMRKELHTGEQDRTVLCVDIFHRAPDGTGWVHTLRMDWLAAAYAGAIGDEMSHAEATELARERATVERRPATPTETQRHLPDLDGTAADRSTPLLSQAAARQGRTAAPSSDSADDGVPAGVEPSGEDDGLGDGADADADLHDFADLDGAPEGDQDDAAQTPAQRAAKESERSRAARRAGAGKRGGKGGR